MLLAGWALVVVLTTTMGRATVGSVLAGPALLPVLAGSGAATTLFAAQADVVNSVADSAGPGMLNQAVLAWFVEHRTFAGTPTPTTAQSGSVTTNPATDQPNPGDPTDPPVKPTTARKTLARKTTPGPRQPNPAPSNPRR